MRVLHVITALGVGGAERMLVKLLEARALAGVEQHVFSMLPGGAMVGALRDTGAPLTSLDFLGGVPVLTGSIGLALAARRCRPDLVHGWMYHGNLGAVLAAAVQPRKVPLIWGIRQSLPNLSGENAFARIGIQLSRWVSHRPDKMLFNSVTSLEQHGALGFDTRRAHYLPNGFDTSEFSPSQPARALTRSQWGVGIDEVVFGMMARYHPAKGHAVFLEAACRVAATQARCAFVMAGTGVDEHNTELVQMVRQLGLQGRVKLLGERQDIAVVLSGLDVYVSASTRIEAFSNSIGEAMSCELPCVVTAIGDSPRVVGKAGIAVAPSEPEALAHAMSRMIELGAVGRASLGLMGRQRIQAEFELEVIAQQHADLYHALLAERESS